MKRLTCQEALRLLRVIYGSQEDVPDLLAGVMVSFSCLPFIVVTYSPIINQRFSRFLGNKGIMGSCSHSCETLKTSNKVSRI